MCGQADRAREAASRNPLVSSRHRRTLHARPATNANNVALLSDHERGALRGSPLEESTTDESNLFDTFAESSRRAIKALAQNTDDESLGSRLRALFAALESILQRVVVCRAERTPERVGNA